MAAPLKKRQNESAAACSGIFLAAPRAIWRQAPCIVALLPASLAYADLAGTLLLRRIIHRSSPLQHQQHCAVMLTPQ